MIRVLKFIRSWFPKSSSKNTVASGRNSSSRKPAIKTWNDGIGDWAPQDYKSKNKKFSKKSDNKNNKMDKQPRVDGENKTSKSRHDLSAHGSFARFKELHKRFACESVSYLSLTPLMNIMTVLVLGITLTFPVMLYTGLLNMEQLTDGLHDTVTLSIYFKKDVSRGEINSIEKKLSASNNVSKVRYVSAKEGLVMLEASLGMTDLSGQIGANPLPDLLEVVPNKTISHEEISKMQQQFSRLPEVDLVQVDDQWLEKLFGFMELGSNITLLMSILFGLAILLTTGNTVRLLISVRQDEIRVIRLVGGTDGYIMLPFIYTGLWFGLLGAICAWLLSGVLFILIKNSVAHLAGDYENILPLTFLNGKDGMSLLIISICIAIVGSWLSCCYYLYQYEIKDKTKLLS